MRFPRGGPLPSLAAALIPAGLAWAGVKLYVHPPEPLGSTGRAHGDRLTGTLTFTDPCGGSATVTLRMIDHARWLDGSYDAQDCEGTHSGEFAVLYYWR